jgi:hypothetical protein
LPFRQKLENINFENFANCSKDFLIPYCHTRESGNPGNPAKSGALSSYENRPPYRLRPATKPFFRIRAPAETTRPAFHPSLSPPVMAFQSQTPADQTLPEIFRHGSRACVCNERKIKRAVEKLKHRACSILQTHPLKGYYKMPSEKHVE